MLRLRKARDDVKSADKENMGTYKILIVDDDPRVLEALQRILTKDYEVLLASSGREGIRLLSKHPDTHIILCDQRMPEMTGVAMLEKTLSIAPFTIRILLTAYSDIEAVIAAINQGQIYRYLTKPWEPKELKLEIQKACEYYDLHQTIRTQNEKLKVLDKAKDNFLMLISHELKTPLTSILSYTESLKRGMAQTKEEKELFLNRVQEGAEKLKTLTEDTLDLITAQTGKLKLTKTSFDLKSALVDVISTIHEKAIKKKILIETSLLDKFKIKADLFLFKKTLFKILEFAIEAQEEAGKISIVVKKDDGVKISVIHTGKALTAKQKKHLFEPFMVAEDILTHKIGAGLALPICKAIIEAHHGTLSIESSKHETLFHISLPLK